MKIKSKTAALVAVEKEGELFSVQLKTGEHDYPELDITNERTYADLKMLQEDMGLIDVEGGIPTLDQLNIIRKKRAKNTRDEKETERRKKEAAAAREKLARKDGPSPRPEPKPEKKNKPDEDSVD